MKRFVTGILILQLLGSAVLYFKFNYSLAFVCMHFATVTAVSTVCAGGLLLFRSLIHRNRAAWLLLQVLAFSYWAYLSLFYILVLGSNFFWGSTITLEILNNYLKNFAEVVSIFPIESWIIYFAIVGTFLLIVVLYLLIRIRKPKENSGESPFVLRHKKAFGIALAVLAVILLICTRPLLNLKRTLQFNQEPFAYFIWGPMWEIHSDQLLLSQPPRSAEDQACIDAISPKPPTDRIGVVILLDALRSDHLPIYNYHRNTTPFLDSLFKAGKLKKIPHAFSGSTNTIGGVSSLFYSGSWDSLNLTQLNLMQYFKRSGFQTYAFLTGYHSGWYGLSAMYRNSCDHFFETTASYGRAIDDDFVTLKELESTRFQAGDFIYIHLLSTHDVGKREERFRIYQPDKIGLTTDKLEPLINHYDNGILQGDYIVSRIFKHLEADSLLSKATIFIVGDHGNLFGEDGKMGHAGGLHPKLLETPILIYDQQAASWPTRDIASLKDIAPTYSELFFGEKVACWRGKSLLEPAPKKYTETVTAATVKTDLYNGLLQMSRDTIRLRITNKAGKFQQLYEQIGDQEWYRRQ